MNEPMILVCGETLFDFFEVPKGRSGASDALLFSAVAGGSPFNVAVGLSRLGRNVALSTSVGRDRLGERAITVLEKEGVDASFVRYVEQTLLALVEVGDSGVPRYSFFGVERALCSPDPALLAPRHVRAIHIGSFIALVSERSPEALLEIARTHAESVLISLDPNIRLHACPDVSRWRASLDRFRQYAHLIKVSDEDLNVVYGADIDPAVIAQSWLTDRTRLVILTRGERGATLFSQQHGQIDVPALPTVVADTVGAGDSFQAAVLCWLDEAGLMSPNGVASLSREQIRELGEFAVRSSALTCSRNGANLPNRPELDKQTRHVTE